MPTAPESSLALALAALLAVLGLRFLGARTGRDLAALVAYAVALGLGWAEAQGLLPGRPPLADAPAPLRIAGGVALVVGLLLAGAAGRARAGAGPGALVATGPYARIRHPLHAGLVLVLLGALARTPGTIAAAATLAAVAALAGAASGDEREAARTHGAAWDAYARATPPWVPRRGRGRAA